MKSYYAHLSSRNEYGENEDHIQRPILRSSGIFPVIKNSTSSSRVLFLGYWLLKRQIPEVNLLVTLRNESGDILLRKSQTIDSVRSFSIELDSLLNEINFESNEFVGSIELEFNTTRDMVFPYPALVLEYFNESFSTCVHTIERIYNDFEDLQENNQFHVPESGFDIYCTDDLDSFMSFVNGPLENNDAQINYTISNQNSQKFSGSFSLGKIKPYETKIIKFRDYISDLEKILEQKSGSISLNHNFEGFYPRLLVGNVQKSFPSVSFTHSYYDCSSCNTESDFWNRINPEYFDSSVYIPLFLTENRYTDLVIYPNFSPSDFTLRIDLYGNNGTKLHEIENYVNINSNDSKLIKIRFKELIEKLNLKHELINSAHIITKFKDRKIPSRIKFGLNVGILNKQSKLPCNICFNTKVGNPNIENKPGSFHWAPVFHNDSSVITIANFSPKKNYTHSADVNLTFYRKQDSESLSKKLKINPYSEFRLILDNELKEFLKNDGWVTIKANNPNIQGYYFNFHESGSVAGDHFF